MPGGKWARGHFAKPGEPRRAEANGTCHLLAPVESRDDLA
jgi:hypothetical protein